MPVTPQCGSVGSHAQMNTHLGIFQHPPETLTGTIKERVSRAQKNYRCVLINVRLKILNSPIFGSACFVDDHGSPVRPDFVIDGDDDPLKLLTVSAAGENNRLALMRLQICNALSDP